MVFRIKTTSKKTTFHGSDGCLISEVPLPYTPVRVLAIIATHCTITIVGYRLTVQENVCKQVKVLHVSYNIVCSERRSDFLSALLPSLPS